MDELTWEWKVNRSVTLPFDLIVRVCPRIENKGNEQKRRKCQNSEKIR